MKSAGAVSNSLLGERRALGLLQMKVKHCESCAAGGVVQRGVRQSWDGRTMVAGGESR